MFYVTWFVLQTQISFSIFIWTVCIIFKCCLICIFHNFPTVLPSLMEFKLTKDAILINKDLITRLQNVGSIISLWLWSSTCVARVGVWLGSFTCVARSLHFALNPSNLILFVSHHLPPSILETREIGSNCYKHKFSNLYLFATWWCKPLTFKT